MVSIVEPVNLCWNVPQRSSVRDLLAGGAGRRLRRRQGRRGRQTLRWGQHRPLQWFADIQGYLRFIFCRYEHRLPVPGLPDCTSGNLPERGDGVRPGRPTHRRHQRGRLYHAPALQAANLNIEWQKS